MQTLLLSKVLDIACCRRCPDNRKREIPTIKWLFRDETHILVGYLSQISWSTALVLGIWSGWGMNNLSPPLRCIMTGQVLASPLLLTLSPYLVSTSPKNQKGA